MTLAIRQNDVTNNVSWVAAIPEVREELVDQQRRIAKMALSSWMVVTLERLFYQMQN